MRRPLPSACRWLVCLLVWPSALRADPAERRVAAGHSLDTQLTGPARAPQPGESISEWEWHFQRYVNLGTPVPATLEETVRVGFANRGDSYVRVTFQATVPAGFPSGGFQGKKMVSYTLEKIYTRVVVRGKRFVAEADAPFRLVASDPPGHSLAEFSTLGGIARGKNMVVVVGEAFRGKNLYVLTGGDLTFVNGNANGTEAQAFPAEIVLEAVK